MIKQILLPTAVLSLVLMASCGGKTDTPKEEAKVQNSGKTLITNGSGGKDSVEYTCTGCAENLKPIAFDNLVKDATDRLVKTLNVPLSFKPKKLELTVTKADSLFDYQTGQPIKDMFITLAKFDYVAKNAMGVELEGKGEDAFYMGNDGRADKFIGDKIRLDSLKFEKRGDTKSINRKLELISTKDERLAVYPFEDKQWSVRSSINCVDEDAWLVITLENDDEVKLVSWNDFNCDGNAWFPKLTKDQAAKLMNSPVKRIIFVTGDETAASGNIPANQKDYFKQAVKLLGY